jgi:hypothetical protein
MSIQRRGVKMTQDAPRLETDPEDEQRLWESGGHNLQVQTCETVSVLTEHGRCDAN